MFIGSQLWVFSFIFSCSIFFFKRSEYGDEIIRLHVCWGYFSGGHDRNISRYCLSKTSENEENPLDNSRAGPETNHAQDSATFPPQIEFVSMQISVAYEALEASFESVLEDDFERAKSGIYFN